ncbi:MAG: DUF1127 domain-containing protein [Rhodospirillaceae bacterium]|nr:DUF1127 domain-containing protein [Rhodospirillaceae bacterium]
MQLLSSLDLFLRRWQRYGEVRHELSLYTDRELADMGVRRSEIPDIARGAAALIQSGSTTPATKPRFAKVAHS